MIDVKQTQSPYDSFGCFPISGCFIENFQRIMEQNIQKPMGESLLRWDVGRGPTDVALAIEEGRNRTILSPLMLTSPTPVEVSVNFS